MTDVIIFAGTTEGRRLSTFLSDKNVKVVMCVATDYSVQLTKSGENLEVLSRRLNYEEIVELIRKKNCSLVVDATHPYAKEITENIKNATRETGIEYIRLIRGAENPKSDKYMYVSTAKAAAKYIAENPMRTLLTIGSKELEYFTRIEKFNKTVFARVLPFTEVVEKCTDLGFIGKQLICMQGPFSHELNVAMINSLKIDCLVTKDSGDVGGFGDKLSAIDATGIKGIIIGRSSDEIGDSYEQVKWKLTRRFGISERSIIRRKMLPIFVSLDNKNIVVIGGGNIAERRVLKMLECGGNITVISPNITVKLKQYADDGRIKHLSHKYIPGCLDGFNAVMAATDDRRVNSAVKAEAESLGLMVNVADRKEEGNFYFPAIIEGEKLIAGLISTDGDHQKVKKAAANLRKVWDEFEKDS